MGFYVELHCDNGCDCPHGAGEEGPQGTHKAKIAAEARKQGWRVVGRRWLCVDCVADLARTRNTPDSQKESG